MKHNIKSMHSFVVYVRVQLQILDANNVLVMNCKPNLLLKTHI